MGAVGRESPIVQMTRDAAGVITSVDDAIVELLGLVAEQLVGSPSTSLIHPADQPGAVAAWMDMITSPGRTGIWRGRYKTAAGSWKWVGKSQNRIGDGDDSEVITFMKEVGPDEVSLEEQFQAREQLLTQLSDALPVSVFQVDLDGRITLTNNSLHLIVGIPPKDSFTAQMSTVVYNDRPSLDAALSNAFAGQSVDGAELRLRADGRVSPGDHAGPGVPAQVSSPHRHLWCGQWGRGVSQRRDRSSPFAQRARNQGVDRQPDVVLQRPANTELVDRTINAQHDGLGRAVIFVDLDGLKAVNDNWVMPRRFAHSSCGRPNEDCSTKRRLRRSPGRRRVPRDLPKSPGAARAVEIARRISSALTASVNIGADTVEMRASIGVVWTMEALDTDTLIARADNAMYESKRLGEHGVTLFADGNLGGAPTVPVLCLRSLMSESPAMSESSAHQRLRARREPACRRGGSERGTAEVVAPGQSRGAGLPHRPSPSSRSLC